MTNLKNKQYAYYLVKAENILVNKKPEPTRESYFGDKYGSTGVPHVATYQYLQYRGYDIPNHLLG